VLIRILPRFIINLLFRSFEARETFLKQVEELRVRFPDRPIAFAMFQGGLIEFLALQLFLWERYGPVFDLRVATRFASVYIEQPAATWRRFLSLFGLAKRPPSRISLCADELNAGRPVLLSFENTDRKKAFEPPKGEKELAFLENQVPNLIVAPVVFIWRRKGKHASGDDSISDRLLRGLVAPFTSPWYLLLGNPYQPTGLRKVFIMLRQYARSTLRLTEPFELRSYQSKVLRRKILLAILQEKKVVLGPVYPGTKLISENILRSASLQRVVRNLAAEEGVSELNLFKKAQRMLDEMSSKFSFFMIEVLAWLLDRIFRTIFEGITTEPEDFEKLRNWSKEGSLVYLPCHKSYVDFLILSYLLFQRGLAPPHVAAGNNMSFWPMGYFFRRGGAFFIRRSFRGNILYSEVLRRYVSALLDNGIGIEFFLEGMRSRNGKLAPPKYGMLKMIVDAKLEEMIKPKIRVVPVAIAYDRVTEDKAHKRELEGGAKVQESALGAIKALRVLFKSFGKVHVRFGDAVSLDEWNHEHIGEAKQSLDTKRLAVQKLAFEVCHRINSRMPLTGVGMASALLLANPDASLPKWELEKWEEVLRADAERLRLTLGPELQEDFVRACRRGAARLLDDKIIEKSGSGEVGLELSVPAKQRIAALYYKNSVIHAFLLPAIAGLCGENREESLELRNLLQFEFFFSDKETYLRNLAALPPGLATGLYAHMLDDVLQNLSVGISGLIQMQGLWLENKEWKNRLMKFGRAAVQAKLVTRPESVNTQSFVAFLELARNRQWLRTSPRQNQLLSPASPGELGPVLERINYFKRKLTPWPQLRAQYTS